MALKVVVEDSSRYVQEVMVLESRFSFLWNREVRYVCAMGKEAEDDGRCWGTDLNKKNISPGLGESNGYRLTNAASGAGDEGCVALEGEHVLDAGGG